MSLGHIITYLCYTKDLNRIFAKKFGNTSVRDAILTYLHEDRAIRTVV